MDHADRIRKLGFRRWYERQLAQAFLHLVSCLLCMLLVAVCLEAFGANIAALERATMLALAVAGTAAAAITWQRFRRILNRTERIGEFAVCRVCGTYARFDVTASGVARERAPPGRDEELRALEGTWLRVRCRKCGHEWLID